MPPFFGPIAEYTRGELAFSVGRGTQQAAGEEEKSLYFSQFAKEGSFKKMHNRNF